ncbi:unnamed protein product (macronuclear) [Paramecium tetraurelia]|uniref:Histidine kinase domain-containing protein n=1 Tax=Paramecium tetraurelia TaxID=5888 RepID=A0DJP3_PARTE|nr:uncharacterized protein GSPATT00017604001 [Paramecium tetraurelia]CAK83260.1 unnamed protein product [Paramecium tetraurelia]|eukprot:XP_001450657.1 hypothetical protein (macronuclear) [Paramecium tetraurelia strain d4-2]
MRHLFLMDLYHSTIGMEEGQTSILPLGDISPFFYWALAIKRLTLVGIYRSEFIYFIFGFLNGIYSSKLDVKDKKKYYQKFKTAFQVILALGLIIFNFLTNTIDYQIVLIVINIGLLVLLGIYDNIEINPRGSKQDGYSTDQRNTQIELKKCQTIVQQNQSTKSIWEQFNNLTDDWICKVDITKTVLNRSWESKEQSCVLKKFLKDNKINLQQFFNHLLIVNSQSNTSQSFVTQFELDESNTFLAWIEKNYLQDNVNQKQNIEKQKQYLDGQDCNQNQEEQPSIISPQNDRKYIFQKDRSQDISGLLAIPINMDQPGPTNKQYLQCQLTLNQIIYNLSLSVLLVDDDRSNQQKQSIIIQIKNINILIKNELLEQKSAIIYRFVGKMANLSSQILKRVYQLKQSLQLHIKEFEKIKQSSYNSLSFCDDNAFIKSDKVIGDFKQTLLNIRTQSPGQNAYIKVTSSNSHNHENQDENLQKLSILYLQQLKDLLNSVESLSFDLLITEQNNFNFYELFSTPQLKIEQFNLIQTFNIVIDIFKYHIFLKQHNIIITQELDNESQLIIQSDKRKLKQILINIINNSIQNFNTNLNLAQQEKCENLQIHQHSTIYQQEIKHQNAIIIKAQSDADKITIEISDNGGGINEEQLKNRLNEGKFGLAACHKQLKYLGYDSRVPFEIINYVKSTTGIKGSVIKFVLPKSRDNFQLNEDSKYSESLRVSRRIEKN